MTSQHNSTTQWSITSHSVPGHTRTETAVTTSVNERASTKHQPLTSYGAPWKAGGMWVCSLGATMPHIDRRCGSRTYPESRCNRFTPRDHHTNVLKWAVFVGVCFGSHASTLPDRRLHQSLLRSTLNEVPNLIVRKTFSADGSTCVRAS